MQATTTVRQTRPGQFKQTIVAIGLIGSLAVGAAAMTLADALPLTGGSNTQAVTSPQITSDQLYTLEAVAGASQIDSWQARLPQVTSDQAFAYEANLDLARTIDARALTSDETFAFEANLELERAIDAHVMTRQITSDEGWALEASLIAEAAATQQSSMTQLTSDEAWAIEQAQLLAGTSEQRAGR